MLQHHKEWTEKVEKIEELSKQSPEAEKQRMLQWGLSQLKEEYTCNPGSWVNRAFSNGMNFKDSWKAIFPNWMPDEHSYVTEEEPDYHRFIQVFTRDTETRLRELVGFALNLNEYRKDNPTAEYNELLEDVNSKLQPKAKDIGDLPSRLVSPQLFVEICSGLDIVLDSRCYHWVEWKMKHPELAGYLKDSGKAKKRVKAQKSVSYPLKEAYDIFVKSYVADVKKGVSKKGLQGFNVKFEELKNNVLPSTGMTIEQKWPVAETLRSQISKKHGSPKKHEDVRKAKPLINTFNL